LDYCLGVMVANDRVGKFLGLKDARSSRGIMSRGPARFTGPGKAPNPGNIFNIQRAARRRLKKMQEFHKR
jgi:hypothetical protein